MDNLNKLVVWGVGTTRTMRVHWLLHELGISYDTRRIESRTGETGLADYSSINPKKKIPTLTDGDMIVTESMAIMRHIRRNYDPIGYDEYQCSGEGLAAYDEWASFILMELDATSLYVIRRHKDLPHIYGEAENAITSSIEYFGRMIDSIVHRTEGQEYLWGSTFSELDILMAGILDWASLIAIDIPPALTEYHTRMTSRPAYLNARKFNFSGLQIPLGR